VLDTHSIVIAPTELSATAPLKLLARSHAFRAATMAGFSSAMIPALRIDYGEVSRRVFRMKALLDHATRAELRFEVAHGESCALTLDLRHRSAHASDGILDRNGVAGNLPSGEAYIVPYEGERPGDPSGSRGRLPVQFGDAVVVFEIENNRAHRVHGEGLAAREQAEWLEREPAYGNLAELGLGVLGDFGLPPTGEILLDEKLGLHVAFGRSDHFGGQVGAAQFSRPDAVVHIDRVYIPSLQPRIAASLDLVDEAGVVTEVVRDCRFVLTF
jgi:leucyl aminopeptidase (aminopeptidase T)